MKVDVAPSSHEELELRQVPLTSPRQKNLQAPEDVVPSQVSSVARAELLHAGASHLDAGHAGHGQPGHGSPGQDCQLSCIHSQFLKLGGKETLTINEISTGARLALRDGKDTEKNTGHPLLDLNLVRCTTLKYTQYVN